MWEELVIDSESIKQPGSHVGYLFLHRFYLLWEWLVLLPKFIDLCGVSFARYNEFLWLLWFIWVCYGLLISYALLPPNSDSTGSFFSGLKCSVTFSPCCNFTYFLSFLRGSSFLRKFSFAFYYCDSVSTLFWSSWPSWLSSSASPFAIWAKDPFSSVEPPIRPTSREECRICNSSSIRALYWWESNTL